MQGNNAKRKETTKRTGTKLTVRRETKKVDCTHNNRNVDRQIHRQEYASTRRKDCS
jgi:hypothetical protein